MKNSNWLKAAFAALVLVLLPLSFAPHSFAADEPSRVMDQQLQVDINSADASAIATALDGVGLVKAQEIVAYREMYGDFRSIDELVEVRGIGMATIDKNRERIVIVSN
jgi:competence protein ComEA